MPQMETPKPKQKMRTFNWNKLPVNKILGKRNIWSLVAKKNEVGKSKKAKMINFDDMEHLFCQQAPQAAAPAAQGAAKDANSDDKKKKDEVRLFVFNRSFLQPF